LRPDLPTETYQPGAYTTGFAGQGSAPDAEVTPVRTFKKSKRDASLPDQVDLRARETAYRRLGHAMATLVVTLEHQPPAGVRLSVRNGSASVTADPMMITHEAPGTKAECHRLWFAIELSTVMFGDGEFLLLVDGAEVELPHPVAFTAWSSDDPNAAPAVAPEALAEGELRAAVAALEERCRAAEALNAQLTADSRRVDDVVSTTLAEVQREREQLLNLVARSNADLAREADRAATSASEQPISAADPNDGGGFMERLHAARGAASADGSH